tara:strand:- start:1979 stop:3061 length:1083 start_codon:yes stop_codon:yes gene_type:complete
MNILIVRLDNIGDIMITSGIACKVKDKYPTAKVVYLVRKINAILPQMYGCIDNVIAYDSQKSVFDTVKEIKSYNFDYIIMSGPDKGFLDILQNIDVPIIRRIKTLSIEYLLKFMHFAIKLESYNHVKIATRKNTVTANLFFKIFPKLCSRLKNNKLLYLSDIKLVHESNRAELLLFPLGITSLNDIATNNKNIASNFKAVGELPTKYMHYFAQDEKFNLVIHPGSNGHGEEWPLVKYIELAKSLNKDKYNVFITGSEQEWLSHGKVICDSCPNVINLINKFNLQEFAIFLTRVDAVVASGTGPLHLAAALGAHSLGLFPTKNAINSIRWMPLGEKVKVFEEKNTSLIKVNDIKKYLENIS